MRSEGGWVLLAVFAAYRAGYFRGARGMSAAMHGQGTGIMAWLDRRRSARETIAAQVEAAAAPLVEAAKLVDASAAEKPDGYL